MNSGAEAVETALKAARKWAYQVKKVPDGKAEIIVCADNFHGRTITVVSFSTEADYRNDFGPFTPGFKVIRTATRPPSRRPSRRTRPRSSSSRSRARRACASAGRLPARGAELCSKENVLFLADEIQTGFGRTGRMFACDHEDVRPDMFILGKALGGGVYPISAVVAPSRVLGVFRPGEHGSTFGGNPLGCAVARTAIKVLVDERLPQRAQELGDYFAGRLREIKSPHVKEVRGRGLLIGVELHPKAGGARRFCEALQAEGLLCKETHTHVIRFAPPLVIERGDIDWALQRIEKVLTR